jgi:hypothetical protein
MHRESEQYGFARIEGYIITLARLQEQFENRAVNLEEMAAAVVEQLAKGNLCAPWRKSETERASTDRTNLGQSYFYMPRVKRD